MTDQMVIEAADAENASPPDATEMAELLIASLADGLDHPELWSQMGEILEYLPDLPEELARRTHLAAGSSAQTVPILLLIMCFAACGQVDFALEQIEPVAAANSQSAQVQGALFHLHGLKDPENDRYRLNGKVCTAPFTRFDVLERSTHLCCASLLHASAGNLSTAADWDHVWNSETAQDVRASIHDGSYRYCNKMACPKIQTNQLVPVEELAARPDARSRLIAQGATVLPLGPGTVNLAYDRTCNLSCPSCRTEKYAADEATRQAYDEMQRERVLPMLKHAELVIVTGSGDPFASKNFRRLMLELTPSDYPDLKFHIMTNGMLFTPKQWESFPALHRRTSVLKISIDAATGVTHELLRRGARWPVMLDNMRFAGQLAAQGFVDHYELVFTVQRENYREMAGAVDLAKNVGAHAVSFAPMTNWGTFSDSDYADKAVFLPSHREHQEFLKEMEDPRLREATALLGSLQEFLRPTVTA